MSFGPDIDELVDEIGMAYTILRVGGNVTGEYLIAKPNTQATKPFIREFFLEAIISYSSALVGGDVIEFDDGRRFLTVNNTPRLFENEVFDKQAVLYKTNVSGELLRLSGESYDAQTYQTTSIWVSVKEDCYGLLTEEMYGNYLDQDEVVGQVENHALVLYIPSSLSIQPLDRYVAFSGETPYKVEEVDRFKYDGVDVAHLELDTRE